MTNLLVEPGAEYPAAEEPPAVRTNGYWVVIEAGLNGWGAYVPDLPGVVAAGGSREEVRELIAEALIFHIEGLRADGLPVPEPVSTGERIAGTGVDEAAGDV